MENCQSKPNKRMLLDWFSAALHTSRKCGRYVNRMLKHLIMIISLCSSMAFAQTVKVEVDDCGPLARGELGVVFRIKPHESGIGYFTKGEASEICPKLHKAKYIIGREEPYCKNYKPYHIRECEHLKVFVIEEYVFE